MTGDDLRRLRHEQGNIREAYGLWGTDDLTAGCRAGAEVAGFGGDPATLDDIAANLDEVRRIAGRAADIVAGLRDRGVAVGWAGDTQVEAAEAVEALHSGVHGLLDTLGSIPGRVRAYAMVIERWRAADLAAADALLDVAANAARMTMLGHLPDPSTYDAERMSALHQRAVRAIDDRVAGHRAVTEAGRDLASRLHDQAAQARGRRMAGAPLSALDAVVLTEAGSDWRSADLGVLTPAQAERAAAALTGLGDADRRAMLVLLRAAASPEQRAYLMKALAAGYPVGEVAAFDGLIAAHGDDGPWLAARLGPFDLDSGPAPAAGPGWSQGQLPTCVAASTVAARAAVDPIYALRLTTGGRPDDPAHDNPAAFRERWRAEQLQVYDDGRDLLQKVRGSDGMTSRQSTAIANEQIGAHTGATYRNVPVDSLDGRSDLLPRIEAAVDDGYPVPVTTRDDGPGHQMMIIGHQGDELQIYNPWGYTFWVPAGAFTEGDISHGDAGLPGTPVSVRLPERTG
ncbi:hypothetical protein Aph02nite_14450 [Actinoplanes philippinensis]|uniref:Peptidoglycan-binding protein n=1 Tax=Actinoplanes philippinensis TaxID=35752 RepID=A0A1I1ZGG4_9ACTN|nr:hypothetical protein [Actinoplanes philippinensis]GIE75495.1 hypothetical protein Aph02nite_14450 [Actinoplanes philippinensis]SFE30809.1 hypothetical protein SAMN05421541_10192 [Actinoplanes philippinensis]